MKSKTMNFQEVRRNSYKSEYSITPIRVPFNGGSQQCGLSKKSQLSQQTQQSNLADCMLNEFKQLCRGILKKIEQNTDAEDTIYSVSKQLQTFERILQKKLDQQIQEVLALKIIHQEDAHNIQKLNKKIEDLQDKLSKLSYSITQTPLQLSPKIKEALKSNNCSIELITKKPFRNTSYSFQETTSQQKNIFNQDEKENHKLALRQSDCFMAVNNQASQQKKKILKPKQFRL